MDRVTETPDGSELDPALAEPPYALQRHLGFKMVAWSEGYCRFELPVREFLMNRYGIPHGGIHATLLDTVMGYACSWTGDPEQQILVMTLSLNVSFLGQAKGDLLIAEGWKTGGGRKTLFTEGRISDDLGTLAATATGVFRRRGS